MKSLLPATTLQEVKMSQKEEFMQFARVNISDETIQEVVDCLKSGWITTGPRVKKFEEKLQEYLGSPHAVSIASATAGLHLALMAMGIKPGDEVITTSFTFVATLNTIVQAGAKPVLVDVERGTYNMDISRVEAAITPHTKAIMPVHYAGAPVDLDPLYALAQKYNLRILEDAAHAIGAEYKGKKIGSFGDVQVFSFHPNKNMTTGEGGCIATRDPEIVKQINIWKFHGIDRESWNRFAKGGSQLYDVVVPGFKFNMMDIQASLGIHQLEALDSFTDARTHRVNRYRDLLGNWEEITLPQAPTFDHRHAWDLFAITINPEKAGVTRDEFMSIMKDDFNIGTGLHWQAPHLFSYYKETFGYKMGDFPNAEHIADHVVSLPLFPQMTDGDQDRVVRAMKHIFKR